jgi:hypothetical protein
VIPALGNVEMKRLPNPAIGGTLKPPEGAEGVCGDSVAAPSASNLMLHPSLSTQSAEHAHSAATNDDTENGYPS